VSTDTGAVRLYLVRHGRAAAGWDDDPDPPLDELGRTQATGLIATLAGRGPRPIISSPMQRCQQTAEPLAQHWNTVPTVDPRLSEIPSPIGVPLNARTPWLRQVMAGRWSDLDERYTNYRDDVVQAICAMTSDSVVTSHFVAINVVIGACLSDDRLVIRSLDNCSITVVDVIDGSLHLVEGGHEADTLIR
jgi:broad specificity phosphatase PhoE